MDIPESMRDELGAWNNGAGIDLESWVECKGNFSLAVGYASVFWPEFVEFDGYILRKGFSKSSLRGFERQQAGNRKSVERIMNHRHIYDIQHTGCENLTKDKIIFLGNILKEIHQAKLQWQFPDRPCVVKFHIPDDADDLTEYQLSFWQARHEQQSDSGSNQA